MSRRAAKTLSVDLVETTGGTQSRARLCQATIDDYVEIWNAADKTDYPFDKPVVVFFDTEKYWCADGFHRIAAAKIAGRSSIKAVIHDGGQRDALLYSAKCNASHGLRRTNEDKRYIVNRFLDDPEWSKKSARWIADECNVSNRFVQNLRNERKPTGTVTGQDGREREVINDNPTVNVHSRNDSAEGGEYRPKHSDSAQDDKETCPNCGCNWWKPFEDGYICDNCKHPWGEPVGDPDDPDVAEEAEDEELGDLEQAEISKEQEKQYQKVRSAASLIVRWFKETGRYQRCKVHLDAITRTIG